MTMYMATTRIETNKTGLIRPLLAGSSTISKNIRWYPKHPADHAALFERHRKRLEVQLQPLAALQSVDDSGRYGPGCVV